MHWLIVWVPVVLLPPRPVVAVVRPPAPIVRPLSPLDKGGAGGISQPKNWI